MKRTVADKIWKAGMLFFLVMVLLIGALALFGLKGSFPVEYGLVLIFSLGIFLAAWLIRDINEEMPPAGAEEPEDAHVRSHGPMILASLSVLAALAVICALVHDFLAGV